MHVHVSENRKNLTLYKFQRSLQNLDIFFIKEAYCLLRIANETIQTRGTWVTSITKETSFLSIALIIHTRYLKSVHKQKGGGG